ncbi:hypothetical protein [Mucilaginibacter rubeus]|uniref:Uncharacterized protein n=1 Tax=Mucilaginibacter rubeus TaxID=2027860 RepID=A0A5C1I4T1_9SPHI|nr:hypothetical protein [Mucilaginibacter rubeus]QEM12973.1 hypothetical protein DEO27_024155 [Mucilaginibacter rubeus]
MNTIKLNSKALLQLTAIKKHLSTQITLTEDDRVLLIDCISSLLTETSFFDFPTEIKISDVGQIDSVLEKWIALFNNLPGWDYCPFCFLADDDNLELLQKNTIITAWFAPSYAYNSIRSSNNRAYEVRLKADGTAKFWFPTFEDAEQYPELYNFKGSWKEAYYLLIETLKKGWPMEEFPEELQQFLKK